jgi:hypothetical protein
LDESLEGRFADTLATIQAAEQAGAESIPSAAYHLQLARAQVDRAKHLLDYGSEENAAPLIARISSDATLALAIAEREAAKIEAAQAGAQAKSVARKNAAKIKRYRAERRRSEGDAEEER